MLDSGNTSVTCRACGKVYSYVPLMVDQCPNCGYRPARPTTNEPKLTRKGGGLYRV